MIVQIINNKRVVLYDSIDNLPIINYQKFNKFILIDSLVGSDYLDVVSSITRAMQYINLDKSEMAITQLQNTISCISLITQEIGPKYLAFAALVKEINGVEVTDISDSGLTRVLEMLNKVPKSALEKVLTKVKKKIEFELSLYFPKTSNNVKSKEMYGLYKRRLMLTLDSIIKGDNSHDIELEALDNELLLKSGPLIFTGQDSFEIKMDKQFNELALFVTQHASVEAKQLTVFEFYNALEYIEKTKKYESNIL